MSTLQNANLGQRKIAYFVSKYPSLTQTFVDREIQELKRRGVKLVIVAIQPTVPHEVAVGLKKGAAGTRYIQPIHWPRFLWVNLYFALTKPWVYLSTFCYMLTRHHDNLSGRAKTLFHFAEGVSAAALLESEQMDHIHAHFADRVAVVAMVASRLLEIPYSVTAHAYEIYAEPVMLREKIANAKFVTTCTAYNKLHLERVMQRHVELVYHGLEVGAIESNSSTMHKGTRPLILSVGRLREKKGLPYLIKACRLLKDHGYHFICNIIGHGSMQKELEQLIVDLKLQDSIALLGALPNTEVMARYAQATLFVQASIIAENADRDGIPNVILESMASGVPVVATRVSGIPEVVDDGVTGLLVNPGDERPLAEAIARLLSDSKLCDRLARKGRQLVEQKFDIRTNTDRLIELFEA
jgi:colanic acid/amylovoran biosynthesis glycosyltransferase